jgi:hypothetical protein
MPAQGNTRLGVTLVGSGSTTTLIDRVHVVNCCTCHGGDRGLIFGLLHLCSPTFIVIRIYASMQVANVNGIRRTVIPTPDNRKVGGSPPPRGPRIMGMKVGNYEEEVALSSFGSWMG